MAQATFATGCFWGVEAAFRKLPGVGKTHLAAALAHAACLQGRAALFTSAVDIVNALAAGSSRHSRFAKTESVTNIKSQIQIVGPHESLRTVVNIGFADSTAKFNRTLLVWIAA